MKIVSEKTGLTYATVEECLEDEKAYDEHLRAAKEESEKKKKEQVDSAKEVKAMYDAYRKAYDKYQDALDAYHDKYHTYDLIYDSDFGLVKLLSMFM